MHSWVCCKFTLHTVTEEYLDSSYALNISHSLSGDCPLSFGPLWPASILSPLFFCLFTLFLLLPALPPYSHSLPALQTLKVNLHSKDLLLATGTMTEHFFPFVPPVFSFFHSSVIPNSSSDPCSLQTMCIFYCGCFMTKSKVSWG